ncbi:MAG: biopolymer transporter ExbD, partial [Planctomycetia bacterium]|nr:biopolymer transporter ExbD [Planctomycetia bacterium]
GDKMKIKLVGGKKDIRIFPLGGKTLVEPNPIDDAGGGPPAEAAGIPHALIINVTAAGTFLVQGREYSLVELDNLLKEVKAENPHQTVVIRSDRNTMASYVFLILHLCEQHNFENVYVTSDKADK